MSEQLTSDVLSRLKRYAEQNKGEPWIPVKATELLALVECAEAAKEYRQARGIACEAAFLNLSAALDKLEAL